ncbi:phosphonate/organophosphate ester transporter subunit; periplasmic binding component of ABC superfamily [uncultured delta proteobacterium]|uniref:Phosphonate/organophosphate ester transporter subunit periplasmic binding component of ABC superfamily n=1 Tax=uncultured delta proteobacterium TaxID=34034 RepID=A0A212K6H9_9DELT|nr:phosphonate/organophosphate ester transporter subunit; periplasmic binding component of ABC superfamily [uncultured delta proteobacterium]
MITVFRKIFVTSIIGLLGMCFILYASVAHAADKRVLNFGIINTEASQNLRSVWEPFLKDMEARTGYTINAFFASDYAGVVTAMQYDKVQLAWYGNKSAMEAVDRAKGEVFMQTTSYDGSDGYYSHLVANVDSPLNTVEDVIAGAKDLTFGNGDPNSTSGFLVPGYYVFAKNGLDPKKMFKRTLNANHETNALSVANKQVDVATCNNEALERLELAHPEKRKLIKVVWTSPLIPSDPLVWRKDLPEDVKKTLREFFMTYGAKGTQTAHEKEVLKALQWGPFLAATDDHLLPIRQLELFKAKGSLAANTDMNEAEKAAKIKEIDDKLVELGTRMAVIKK